MQYAVAIKIIRKNTVCFIEQINDFASSGSVRNAVSYLIALELADITT
jgi:hypothetical protein